MFVNFVCALKLTLSVVGGRFFKFVHHLEFMHSSFMSLWSILWIHLAWFILGVVPFLMNRLCFIFRIMLFCCSFTWFCSLHWCWLVSLAISCQPTLSLSWVWFLWQTSFMFSLNPFHSLVDCVNFMVCVSFVEFVYSSIQGFSIQTWRLLHIPVPCVLISLVVRFCRLSLKLLSILLLLVLDVFLLLLPIFLSCYLIHIPVWSISFYLSFAICVHLVYVFCYSYLLSSHSVAEHFVLFYLLQFVFAWSVYSSVFYLCLLRIRVG